MNIKDFKSALREIVRDELKSVLPEILNEWYKSTKQPVVEATKKVQKPAVPTKQVASVKKQPKQYVSDPILNKILNETTGGVPKDGMYTAPVFDMAGASIHDNLVTEEPVSESEPSFLSESVVVDSNEEEAVTPNIQSISGVPIPPSLTNIFNRNYSEVMKAIDAKKGIK